MALGWGIRRFHDNIYTFSNRTEVGASQANTLIKISPAADVCIPTDLSRNHRPRKDVKMPVTKARTINPTKHRSIFLPP